MSEASNQPISQEQPVSQIAKETMSSLMSPAGEKSRDPQDNEATTPSPTLGKKRSEPSATPSNEPMKVPKRKDISPNSMQSPEGVVKYVNRKNAGSMILNIKSPLEDSREWGLTKATSSRRCLIDHLYLDGSSEPAVGTQQPVRYMFTPTDVRSVALDRRFTHMLDEFMTRGGLPEEVKTLKTAVGMPSQDTVVCFGRICCEATEGKINIASVLLEGGRLEGGRRIKLVLNELPEYALFPGQFVMVEGMNTSGNKMIVKKLCEGVPSPLSMTQPSKLQELYYGKKEGQQQGEPLKLMVASGPFSCNDNLEYEPFRDLMHQAVVTDPVDVLILSGPFIDVHHPNINNGMAGFLQEGCYENVDPWTLFLLKISGTIEAFFTTYPNSNLQIVLVPSLSDVHHDVVFPQPPFRDRVKGGVESPFYPEEKLFSLEIPDLFHGDKHMKRVHCVGNPSMITINEVVIGISATDVLFHLSKEEVAHRQPGVHRLEKVVEQLVKQQSFYPLFPASGESMPLDMLYADKWRMPVSPDVLIVPSKLATFAKKLTNGTLAINPGQLAKGSSGGSFAKLTVYPVPADKLSEAANAAATTAASNEGGEPFLPHQVAGRTSIEIKRI